VLSKLIDRPSKILLNQLKIFFNFSILQINMAEQLEVAKVRKSPCSVLDLDCCECDLNIRMLFNIVETYQRVSSQVSRGGCSC